MNKKGKSKKVKGTESKMQTKGKKSKGRNNNIMIQEDEEENETMDTSNQYTFLSTKFSLNNISLNVYGYLSEFLGLKELSELGRVNKRAKIIVKKCKLLNRFIRLRSYFKSNSIMTDSDIFSQKSAYLEKLNSELSKEYPKSEVCHLIQELLYSLVIKKELTIPAVLNENIIKYLNLLLSSERCPYEKICINSNTQMVSIFNLLTQLLKKTKILKKLELLDLRFDFMNLQNFSDALTNCLTLRNLTIRESTFWAPDDLYNTNIRLLMNAVEKSQSILHLTLNLSNQHQSIIGTALAKNKSIKTISFNKDLQAYDFLRLNDTIETVEFTPHAIKNKGLRSLSQCLNKTFEKKKKVMQNISNVNTLIFTQCPITSSNINLLSTIIEKNHTIRKLEISSSNLRDVAAAPLYEVLKNNTTLKVLSLNKSRIDSNGFHLLKESLRLNNSIEELYLNDNNIYLEPPRIQDFINVLESKPHIRKIELAKNSHNFIIRVEELLFNREMSKLNEALN